MMGFGASSLIIGNLISSIMKLCGWQKAYILLSIALGVVLAVTAFVLHRPTADTVLPSTASKKQSAAESFEVQDYAAGEMVKRISFWMAFVCLGLLGAVGSSVISFARDLALSVGAEPALATTLVGVLSVCNGLGRIFTGALFDAKGRRFTMFAANILTIGAAGVTLLAVMTGSLPLCVAGLCLVGMSYGSCPTVSSAFVSAFYGAKFFPTNFSLMNFNLIGSSLMATACSSLQSASGSYVVPFTVLLGLSVLALGLNVLLKRP